MPGDLKLMIVAGEASGDSHAAELALEILRDAPDTFFGAAGPEMRAAGVEPVVESDAFSVVGIGAVAKSVPMFLGVFNKLTMAAKLQDPDAVILVDFPEFNLKLARSLKKQGHLVIYYISPQIWAWRKYRTRTMRRYVDLVLSILPFEKEWYARQGIDHVVHVGNPLLGEVRSTLSRSEFCSEFGLRPEHPIVSLLPGSRSKEMTRILPEMLAASSMMAETDPTIQFVIPLAPNRSLDEVSTIRKMVEGKGRKLPDHLICVQGETYEALNASDAAAVTSGTATLEAGILGIPMAVVYKVPQFDYRLLKPFVDVPHIGLINLVAGERLAKELIQDEFTAGSLSDELLRLLDPKENREMRDRLRRVAGQLQHDNNEARAGEVILKFIRSKAETGD